MDDLISRKAAIDALFKLYEYQRDIDPTEAADLVRQGVYLAEKKIEQLPPAQPETHEERTETHACDCISRHAAIEAFDNLEWFHQNANKDMVSGANPEHHQAWYKEQDVYKALERVPSAQAEIIRCKDCKYVGTDATCCFVCNREGMGLKPYHVYHDDFCSYAERKTDGFR